MRADLDARRARLLRRVRSRRANRRPTVRCVSGHPGSVIIRAGAFIVGYLERSVGNSFFVREVTIVLDFVVIFGDSDEVVRGDGQRFGRPLQPFRSLTLGLLDSSYSLTHSRVIARMRANGDCTSLSARGRSRISPRS